MLRFVRQLIGYDILARDGAIGTVADFLFEDDTWRVKWLVVDTGKWLPDRKVLIAPRALETPDADHRDLPVQQTRAQVKDAPEYDSDPPVSHQEHEKGWDRYYRWLPYMPPVLATLPPGAAAIPIKDSQSTPPEEGRFNPRLRSARTVIGYRIGAQDGNLGHIDDFLINDDGWTVELVVVKTSAWLPGKRVALPATAIARIVWAKEEAEVAMSRASIEAAPEVDPSQPLSPADSVRLAELLQSHESGG
jgi:uncharacterized protein YrrD